MPWLFNICAATALVTCLISGVFYTYRTGYVHGSTEIQAQWDAEKAQMVEAQRIKEVALQANMDALQKRKNNELASLNRTVNALSDSLRDRAERPESATPASAGDGAPGCTGAELYRPDGQFLVRESERADRIRLALKECQAAYSAAAGG